MLWLWCLLGCTREEPRATESCATTEVRYAIAVNATGQGLHLYTATGDVLIPCREACDGPSTYDFQELQRRLAAARPWHVVDDALLIAEVPEAVQEATVSAMEHDANTLVDGQPAPLFDVVLGDTACLTDLQSRILVPPDRPGL